MGLKQSKIKSRDSFVEVLELQQKSKVDIKRNESNQPSSVKSGFSQPNELTFYMILTSNAFQ